MADTDSPSFTVLRIKRKATEPPLSSLVIQDESAPVDRLTSRIKKRRDVSGRPKGVFRLAETVPHTWEGKGSEGEMLKSRIKDLLATAGTNTASTSTSSPPSGSTSLPDSVPQAAGTSNRPVLDGHDAKPPSTPLATAAAATTTTSKTAVPTTTTTQYRVIPPPPTQRSMLPPKVLSAKELESGSLVFVDAQAISTPVIGGGQAGPSRRKSSVSDAAGMLKEAEASAAEDEEMASFLPMLQEYLKLERSKPTSTASPEYAEPATPSAEDKYVYDLYYRDLRPSAVTSVYMGVGDGVGPMSTGVGALIGYEDFSPPSTPSESEAEDEADEDSNEEDFYRNDYPEDEVSDEDDGVLRGGAEEEEDDWSADEDEDGDGEEGSGDSDASGEGTGRGRGVWDYR